MRDYSTARTIFSILEFVAWTAVVIGIAVAIMGASAGGYYSRSAAGLAGAVPGLILSFLGLIGAAIVQNCRAGVDTAEMTGKMLKISKEQLQIAKQAQKVSFQGHSTSPSKSYTVGLAGTADELSRADNPTAPATTYHGDAGTRGSETTDSAEPPYTAEIEHMGEQIRMIGEDAFWGDQKFSTVVAAKDAVEARALRRTQKSEDAQPDSPTPRTSMRKRPYEGMF